MENKNQETVMVNNNEVKNGKKGGALKKVAKFLGLTLLGTAAAVGVDKTFFGGKCTQYVTDQSKKLWTKVTTKTTAAVENQGGQNYRHNGDRRDYRPRYNNGNGYQKPVTENC